MDAITALIVIILTFSAFYFPLKIFLSLSKYQEAALGLIFTNLKDSIQAFKVYAIAVLIFAIGRLIDLFNIFSSSPLIDDFVTSLNLITTVLLIYAFYKLFRIIKIEEKKV
jgi:hypothetical protein